MGRRKASYSLIIHMKFFAKRLTQTECSVLDTITIIITVIKKNCREKQNRELSCASKKSGKQLKFSFKMFRAFLLFSQFFIMQLQKRSVKKENFTEGILLNNNLRLRKESSTTKSKRN